MGHPGRSRQQKAEGALRFKAPRACPDCGSRRVAPAVQTESKTFIELDVRDGRIHVY